MSINAIIDESAKRILEESIYSGTGYISTKDEVSTESFASMKVSAADTIIPENIKENETILGVIGNYGGAARFIS